MGGRSLRLTPDQHDSLVARSIHLPHVVAAELANNVHSPAHPAAKSVPSGWKVYDEIYIIKSFDKSAVHGLLGLNAHPNLSQMPPEEQKKETRTYFPVSWCKQFGEGRVYYHSLGHREDVWDPTWKEGTKDRKNSPEIAHTYQDMILGGILWALKLKEADSPHGNVP